MPAINVTTVIVGHKDDEPLPGWATLTHWFCRGSHAQDPDAIWTKRVTQSTRASCRESVSWSSMASSKAASHMLVRGDTFLSCAISRFSIAACSLVSLAFSSRASGSPKSLVLSSLRRFSMYSTRSRSLPRSLFQVSSPLEIQAQSWGVWNLEHSTSRQHPSACDPSFSVSPPWGISMVPRNMAIVQHFSLDTALEPSGPPPLARFADACSWISALCPASPHA
mmetsp:Transcript_42731/g.106979  ORF Transcript_42731/g.106979 Transcript_42731/m.106979 type:complete len:223 (-) Transcript_42731:56-724(-)